MSKFVTKLNVVFLSLLLFVLIGAPGRGWAQYSGTGTFNKITAISDLTDGYYVIAYGTTFAMNSTNTTSFFTHTAITPSGTTLTDPSTAIVWKILTHVDGGRTIYNEVTSKYVSYTGTSNAAYAVSSITGGSERWTFAWSTTIFTCTNVTSTTRLLQYNTGSPRFACYTGSQQNLTLYKLTSGTPPTLSPDATNNDVDHAIDNTFTDDATWRAAVTAVKIGGTALTLTTDYVFTPGNLQLKPSGGNTLLTISGSKAVSVVANGYSDATVAQVINPGAATKLGMKTQPTAPATNGGVLATQPAVYIQDQYGNTTTSTASVVAAVGAGTWTLGGTTSVAAVAGTTTYSGLTATSAAAVTGATISFTSAGLTPVISGTFNIPAPPPPALTADVTNNDVDNAIDITFTENATWRAAVTAVKIGGTALTVTTDYVFSSGNLQLKPSGLNALLTTSGSKAVTVEATGFSVASVTQDINAGTATKLGMKTQPTAPASNGAVLATQPAVYIQDQYGNTTTSTSSVVAAVGAGTWTLGGTTSVAAVAGTTAYIGLTATSPAAVTGATISFTSAGLTPVTSATFNIPAPPPPALTADVTNNDVDNAIDITFTENATWRAAVTAVKIGGTALTVTTDYVFSSGNLQLKPSGLNALLTTSGSKAVTVEATGYSVASVTQMINAGAATKLGMKTQPTAPASNGAVLATQPAVYIQDQYGNTTTSTSSVVAAVGAGTWTLGGTTSVAAVAGTTAYIGLTATSPAAVTGATIAFTSGSLTGVTSSAFDITAPLGEPTNHPGSFTATPQSGSSITVTWTDATGGQVPTGYLVKAAVNPATPAAPADGTPESDGTLVKNISTAVQLATFTGLTSSTTYNFSIWPYTNSGSAIDYKIGSQPTSSAATMAAGAGDFFRSKASGNWNSTATWESSSDGGTNYVSAGATPGALNTVFIQTGHTVTLTQNEACFNLNVSNGTASGGSGNDGVVQLGTYTLEVNGSLRSYYGAVGATPGTGDNTVSNMIVTTSGSTGVIKFVGNSRDITTFWGAGNTGALTAFAVDISLTAGQTATMSKSIKGKSWVITSGILNTGSSRIAADNGSTGGGDVTVNSGATIISSSSGTLGNAVIGRTTNATTGYGGTLTNNGTIKLSGTSPTFAMSTFTFNGMIEYNASGIQTLAVGTGGGSSPTNYTNLTLSGTSAKTLGVNTTVTGTLTIAGTTTSLALGSFALTYGSSSTLEYAGSTAQSMTNTEFPASPTTGPKNLDISNSNGVTLNSDKVIDGTLTVKLGTTIDASTYVVSGTGDFDVQAGSTIKTANTGGLNGSNTTSGGSSSYSTTANYIFNGTSAQLIGAYLPATINNLTIDNAAGVKLSNTALTVNGTLLVNSGKLFTIESGKQVTVTGTLTNTTAANLVINSGGSLIQSSASVAATVQRNIPAWVDAAHGWHLLSSPVTAQAVATAFTTTPDTDYDFYAWWEPTNEWVNFKNVATATPYWSAANTLYVNGSTVDGGTGFIPGKGYLAAYAATSTRQFAGTLNKDNIGISNLAISAGNNNGWHLLGNPFTSAITWGTGWTLTHINATAKIWNEATASYADISTGGKIPALNGFMVQVVATFGGNNSLTIPISARTHDATAWYKSTDYPHIVLVASDPAGQTAQESVIRFDEGASAGFDAAFDSHFLPGYAPWFYSVAGDEHLSTNSLPEAGGTVHIPVSFVKNDGTSFTIYAKTISGLFGPVILNDLKTNTSQDLTLNPEYSFTSAAGDDPNRFLVTFHSVGINEAPAGKAFSIYTSGNNLYVTDITGKNQGVVYIYNLMGQLLSQQNIGGNVTKININAPTGYYLVKVVTSEQAYTTKVFIK